MKRIRKFLMAILLAGSFLSGCQEDNKDHKEDSLKFKESYESLNGVMTGDGEHEYRTITIPEDNPFIWSAAEEVVAMMEDKKTFVVYFGANWCPWCRSVLPSFITVCQEMGVDPVYYVDVRPDNDKEQEIRDVYALDEDGNVYLSHEGTEGYHRFIELAAPVLRDYSTGDVASLDGTPYAGAKRVGAPSFILIKDGQAVQRISGISGAEDDPYMELTDEILADMRSQFESFLRDAQDSK